MRSVAHLIEILEEPCVKDLLTVCPIEALDERILIRFSGLNVADKHPMALSPLCEDFTEKLRAVVYTNHVRQRSLCADLLEDTNQARSSDRGVNLDGDGLTVEVIDDIEDPEPRTTVQRVGNEVRR